MRFPIPAVSLCSPMCRFCQRRFPPVHPFRSMRIICPQTRERITPQSPSPATTRIPRRSKSSFPVKERAPPPAVPVVINEVDSDQDGTDMAEFVELFDGGTGNTDLSGLVLVFFNGTSDVSYAAYDLDGFSTNAAGYFVAGNAAVPNVVLFSTIIFCKTERMPSPFSREMPQIFPTEPQFPPSI
ncbi:MAG: hypothetical protein R3C26_00745 [Calditrichia bacterium]